ncbi:hypothetical protein HK102_000049, partial [Quaeritorhiza haematococci]
MLLILVDILRREVVVMTKAGYITKALKSQNQGALLDADIAWLSETIAHSMSPRYLEEEISKSLDRLGMECIDVFMLNNPERMLSAKNKNFNIGDVYKMTAAAFEHLNKEVARGRISSFGICSTSMSISTAPDHLDLNRIIQQCSSTSPSQPTPPPSSTATSNPLNHFVAVQYPLNVFERQALEPESVHSIAKRNGIFQFTHRPLMAIVGPRESGKIRILTTDFGVNVEDESKVINRLTKMFEKTGKLELDLYDMNLKSLTNADLSTIMGKFVWAQVLSENLAILSDNLFAAQHYLQSKVIPVLDKDLKEFEVVTGVGEDATYDTSVEADGDGGDAAVVRSWIREYRE